MLHASRIKTAGPLVVLGAHIVPNAFAIVIGNLLRNVFLYATDQSDIRIACGTDWLSVTNDCPPLDPQLLANLTLRYVRATRRNGAVGWAVNRGGRHHRLRSCIKLHLSSH